MSDAIAADRYTRALFELAEKEKKLPEVSSALERFKDILGNHPEILRLVDNPTLSNDEKFRFVENILAGNVPELLSRFFKVLLEKKRFALLPAIQALFHHRLMKKQGFQDRSIETIASGISAKTPFGKL